MAPDPNNPRRPIWHARGASQAPGSAAPSADGENNHRAQQTSLGSMPGETNSSYQSTSHSSQPSPQYGQAIPSAGSMTAQEHINQSMTVPRHASQGDEVAVGATSTRVTRSRRVKQNGAPLSHSDAEVPSNNVDQSNSSGSSQLGGISLAGQTETGKRKASTLKSASESIKAPRAANARSARQQSRAKPPGGGDGEDPSEAASDMEPRSSERPLCSLREIVMTMIRIARQYGLGLYVVNGRQHYMRVGTLCSGTDAPIHVMNLFGMLKNSDGEQVFYTINTFGCEIEPFKQGFLIRNSKPELLFKDAKDFAQGEARRARLVTGAEADIPPVDIFIAGTSCVDFSSLSSTKIRDYAGLSEALKEWKALKQKHGDKLSFQHLSDDAWRAAISAMSEETDRKHTSTKTFAAAMNFAKWRFPMILIFENVDSAPWQKLIDSGIFQLMGYTATVHRLDTKHYHMPQTRVRKYLIAFSHRAFTLEGAQALCKMFDNEILPHLKHPHSNSVTDFILPPNSLELHRARNEMELAAQSVRERESNWAFSKSRHTGFRRKFSLPDLRLWIQWLEWAHANAPVKMWKPWANREPCRVLDVLECMHLFALFGRGSHGAYDITHKAQIIDASQNVDRITPDIEFGRTGCLTPNAIPVLTLEARPITGTESLRLQGLPVENFDMSVETQAQLQDLAGNAMTTTVVGAVILAALSAVARVGQEGGFNWLQEMFQQGDYEPVGKISNSFHDGGANIDHGTQEQLVIKLYAHRIPIGLKSHPQSDVRDILALGKRARRRCPCQHILSYSSIELYNCAVCGTSLCKSCKGNPEHALVKSPESLEDLQSLSHAQAEYEFRKCFPQMLWMRSETGTLVQKLDCALLTSTYDNSQRGDLAKAIIEGLCNSTYQLQFVEITDALRLEYVADSTFILRVVVEEAKIIWYLHLDQFSPTGNKLIKVLSTSQPIARAVLGRAEQNQFPGAQAWEFWIPHKVSFALDFRVEDQQALCLIKVGNLEGVPDQTQRSIKELQGSLWKFHPECGFAENALWVYDGPDQKLFLFKDIDPVGKASEDAFVISPTSREMGRTPHPENRPVLLRIHQAHQIHRNFKEVLAADGPFLVEAGHKLPVKGFIDGWWERAEKHDVHVEAFPNMEYQGVRALAKGAPTSIRGPGDLGQADHHQTSCDEFQSLLTTSLPILGNDDEVMKTQETLKTLDLTQQLDLAELTRLIGPLYSAVEMGLVGTGHRVSVIEENVKLESDCASCAPKIPEVFYVKAGTDNGGAPRATGSAVARHRATDQQIYEQNLQSKPPPLHIDHNVTSPFNDGQMKKDGLPYVDIRFIAHGHALLQQARSHLPEHSLQYDDTMETRGKLAMEVGVIENPRVVLHPATISAPQPVPLEDARRPTGFQNGLKLFKEQSDSLQWMLERESVDDLKPFTETETAEVYQDKLHLRVHADAKRIVYRRGRVVADNVGFGKTAVCLGLIDCQRDTDRMDFMEKRETNTHLSGLVHLHATLVIVPNQLTEQWTKEARRFLGQSQYNIVTIQTFAAFQKQTVASLKDADIIICSNKVFQDNKYHSEMSRYCSTNDLNRIQTQQKVYRAWYKQFQSIFGQVRDEVIKTIQQGKQDLKKQQLAALLHKLDQIRTDLQKLDGDEELCFAPADDKIKQSSGKPAPSWVPLLLLEMFSYSRTIWDEFTYTNFQVTEFVANCATTSKWMLSGTPPMDTLGDICKVAYLFNVHVARPLQLIKGRQPPMCEHEPLAPHSDLESTSLFQSRHSPRVLTERHEQSLAFVRFFMRMNNRKTDVSKIEKPIVLTMSPICFLSYAELQVELRSRQYNANNVGAECRRRLMSRVDWKGKENGRDRSVEALMIRASASGDDVLSQSGLAGSADLDAAHALLSITENEIQGIEDRGRELLGKAIFMAYRLAFITTSNAKDELDGQDERQIDYYQNLVGVVQSVLSVDINIFQSWDAFESAMRMVIWDEGMRKALGKFRKCPRGLPPILSTVFSNMKFCEPPTAQPVRPQEADLKKTKARTNFEAKKKFLETFRDWLTKTPLHSRRWFLFDKVGELDAAEDELLRLEWSKKVPWENDYASSEQDHSRMVVPISKLREPLDTHQPDEFDLEHLKALDESRRDQLRKMENVSPEELAAIKSELHDYKDNKAFWEEECNRRGLVAKSTDKKEALIARVSADMAKIGTDKDYVSPESCGVTLTDFPQPGKKRIRGGNMEVIFDGLMQAVDSQTSVYERLVATHSRRNLQEVFVTTLQGTWVCHDPKCGNNYDAHYVSLLCGHVSCGQPDDSRLCGVGLCQRRVKDVCIPLSNITKTERVIAASSLSGAITQDPDSYLDPNPAYQESTRGPKARAVINLIRRIEDSDQVVIFVQNAAMEKDIYSELAAANISHVNSSMLSRDEAGSIERFKDGRYKVLVQIINSEQAAGSNLHNANHVIIMSPLISRSQSDWDAHMKQALGRCVRFRQSKNVYVYHMLMDETMEVDTLEWRMKREVIVTDGQAAARFNQCSTKDFLARYEDDESATELPMAPDEGRAHSILPRDDIQYLMGDDLLSLAAIKALRTIDESIAENGVQEAEEVHNEVYLLEPEVNDEEQDEDMDEDIYNA